MLVSVTVLASTDGYRARATDLGDVSATAADTGIALARLRLAIEAELTRRIATGEALPAEREPASGEYQVHINLAHLAALATHQARQRG